MDFRERIRVNGEKIPPQAVANGLTILREISAGWSHLPTFFEISTALALHHFAEERCDLVVLETGMGGALDATNAVVPLVSVITPIALDHTRWLGIRWPRSREKRRESSNLACPLSVPGRRRRLPQVLAQRAASAGSSLEFIEAPFEQAEIGLRGIHQRRMPRWRSPPCWQPTWRFLHEAAGQGLRDVRWPGRFQVVDERIVLDACHNPHAAAQLLVNWRDVYGMEKATVIFRSLGR